MATEVKKDEDIPRGKGPKYRIEYKVITNKDPKIAEGLRAIGIKLDAELRAKEEAEARKAKTGRS